MKYNKTEYNLFLDDIRNPGDCVNYMWARMRGGAKIYERYAWIVVRNYDSFVRVITKLGVPTVVSFDHDLGDIIYDPTTGIDSPANGEKTGYDCAVWLTDYCREHETRVVSAYVHSMNPVGTKKISDLMWNNQWYHKKTPL